MISILRRTGEIIDGDIADVLAAVDSKMLADLPAMAAEWRPGVVTSLAIMRCILRLFGDTSETWSADVYRSVWDAQLGPETRRLLAPLDEPALFQPPMDQPSKAQPFPIQHMVGFAGLQHTMKKSYAADYQTIILGILGGTWRPHANYHPATARSGALVLLPGDGTLGAEILVLSEAMKADAAPAANARDHFPWLQPRPSKPKSLATLPSPWLDIERSIRLSKEGLLVEPSNNRWVVRDTLVDPSMAVNLSGSSAGAPWRPTCDSHAALIMHKSLAGTKDLARPDLMRAVDQKPQVRVCVLHGVQGTTEGYREWEVAIPRKTASVFARSPDVVAEKSQRILDAVDAMTSALRRALAAAQLSKETRRHYVSQASDVGRQDSVELLLNLAPQENIHQTMRQLAWQGFDGATLTAKALDRARGESRLRIELNKAFPMPEQEKTMSTENPRTVRQAHAAIKAMDERLSAHDRAKLRTAVPGQLSLAVTAIVLSGSRRADALEGAEGEAWETAALALGSMHASGPAVGRLLAQTGYPEMRMQQLLVATGSGLRAQVRTALRWLVAHASTSLRLGDMLALMLADARGDSEALRHARRELAVAFVRQEADMKRSQPEEKGAKTESPKSGSKMQQAELSL